MITYSYLLARQQQLSVNVCVSAVPLFVMLVANEKWPVIGLRFLGVGVQNGLSAVMNLIELTSSVVPSEEVTFSPKYVHTDTGALCSLSIFLIAFIKLMRRAS